MGASGELDIGVLCSHRITGSAENRLWGDQGQEQEALRCCGSEKGLGSGCSILKVEPTGLAEIRETVGKRKE